MWALWQVGPSNLAQPLPGQDEAVAVQRELVSHPFGVRLNAERTDAVAGVERTPCPGPRVHDDHVLQPGEAVRGSFLSHLGQSQDEAWL